MPSSRARTRHSPPGTRHSESRHHRCGLERLAGLTDFTPFSSARKAANEDGINIPLHHPIGDLILGTFQRSSLELGELSVFTHVPETFLSAMGSIDVQGCDNQRHYAAFNLGTDLAETI